MDALGAMTMSILFVLGIGLSAGVHQAREWIPVKLGRAIFTAGFLMILTGFILFTYWR